MEHVAWYWPTGLFVMFLVAVTFFGKWHNAKLENEKHDGTETALRDRIDEVVDQTNYVMAGILTAADQHPSGGFHHWFHKSKDPVADITDLAKKQFQYESHQPVLLVSPNLPHCNTLFPKVTCEKKHFMSKKNAWVKHDHILNAHFLGFGGKPAMVIGYLTSEEIHDLYSAIVHHDCCHVSLVTATGEGAFDHVTRGNIEPDKTLNEEVVGKMHTIVDERYRFDPRIKKLLNRLLEVERQV